MSALVQKLHPWYHLWLTGWHEFFAAVPGFRRAMTLQLPDGTAVSWRKRAWVPAEGRIAGQLLDPHRVLLRQISLPPVPPSQIRTAVEAEVLNASPFPPDQTLKGFACNTTSEGVLNIEVAIARQNDLASCLTGLAVYAKGNNGPIPVRLPRARVSTWTTRALLLLLVTILFFYALAPLLYARQKTIAHIQAFDRLQQKTAQIQRQREHLLMQHTQYQQLLGFQAVRPDPLVVLDRLSAAIPDHSYLVFFSLQEQQVSMEGQTPNALTLLNQLQSIPGFVNVQLSGAVQRHPQTGKDIFQLQMRFQP